MYGKDDYAVVTGGNSGIGLAIAKSLAKHGYNILLVARNEQRLTAAAKEIKDQYGVITRTLVSDLSSGNAPQQIFDHCINENLKITILINNAGIGEWGLFHLLNKHEQLKMMHVNMDALVSLCHLFIPLLKKNKYSFILNVSGTSGYQAIPTMSVYAATKSFIRTFTRGLYHELRGTEIHVCCLVPGPTRSRFIENARMGHLQDKAKIFEMPAQKVADIAIKKMFSGTIEIVPGLVNKMHRYLRLFFPAYLLEKLIKKGYANNLPKE